MAISDLVGLRGLKESDKNFILNSWLKSLRAQNQFFAQIPAKIYFEVHAKSIQRIFHTAQALIAHPINEPDIVIGYLIYDPSPGRYVILHYGYVKNSFREMGLFRLLLDSARAGVKDAVATHYTNLSLLGETIKFNPYFFPFERL